MVNTLASAAAHNQGWPLSVIEWTACPLTTRSKGVKLNDPLLGLGEGKRILPKKPSSTLLQAPPHYYCFRYNSR
jgi:hypothetical protein